jgi:hypothetical protein
MHTDDRAGYPRELAPWAKPGVTAAYAGGQVGGSKLFQGGPPTGDGAIFGFDYVGCGYWPHRLFLGWANGRKVPLADKGYRTDTFKVPDPFSHRLIHKHSEEHGEGE